MILTRIMLVITLLALLAAGGALWWAKQQTERAALAERQITTEQARAASAEANARQLAADYAAQVERLNAIDDRLQKTTSAINGRITDVFWVLKNAKRTDAATAEWAGRPLPDPVIVGLCAGGYIAADRRADLCTAAE